MLKWNPGSPPQCRVIDGPGFQLLLQLITNCRNYIEVLMGNNLYNHLKDQCPDIKHLIQSIQRIEGNPDCFGKSDGHCERQDCLWREYCLKEK
jgi:hypothetical protein